MKKRTSGKKEDVFIQHEMQKLPIQRAENITCEEKSIYKSETICVDLASFHEPIKKREYHYPGFIRTFEKGLMLYFRNSEMTTYFLNQTYEGQTITQRVLEIPETEIDLKINLIWSLYQFNPFFDNVPQYQPEYPETLKVIQEAVPADIFISQESLKNIYHFLTNELKIFNKNIDNLTQKDVDNLQRGFFNKKIPKNETYQKTVFLTIITAKKINDSSINSSSISYFPGCFKPTPEDLIDVKNFAAQCN